MTNIPLFIMFCRTPWITLSFGAVLLSSCATTPSRYRNDHPYSNTSVSAQYRDGRAPARSNHVPPNGSVESEEGLSALTQKINETNARIANSNKRHQSNLKSTQQLDAEIAQVQQTIAHNTKRLNDYRKAIGDINDMLGNLPESESPAYLENKRERLLSERAALKQQWDTLAQIDRDDRQDLDDLQRLRSETILSRRYRDLPPSPSSWIPEGTNKLKDIHSRHGFR